MGAQARILIVDDEPLNIDYLEQELEDLQFVTLSAADGVEALEQVEAEAPDLILLDIMMPRMDGFAVLERLKAEKKWRDIPVVVISAMTDLASIARGIEMGAEDYLPKPFDPVLLQARISSGLEKKRLPRPGARAPGRSRARAGDRPRHSGRLSAAGDPAARGLGDRCALRGRQGSRRRFL